MRTSLDAILDYVGYAHRPQQDALYGHLLDASPTGVIAQAGTGTGKSLAVLAAARDWARRTGLPSLVVTPTNVLMDQYVDKDAPIAAQALGIEIRSLKGRAHYLCSSAPGWRLDRHLVTRELEDRLGHWHVGVVQEVTRDEKRFGCPGSDDCDPHGRCHYRLAKDQLETADIIVTNAHLMVINERLLADTEGEMSIFPDLGAVFVDEAHTLEGVARGFTESSISRSTLEKMLPQSGQLLRLMDGWNGTVRDPAEVGDHLAPWLQPALVELSKWAPGEDEQEAIGTRMGVRNAAKMMIRGYEEHAFTQRNKVLWFDPPTDLKHGRLVSTTINLAGMMNAVLTVRPFALVSATVPSTMAGCLGVRSARFIDVGHPFDYATQATIGFSKTKGDFRSTKEPDNFFVRAKEMLDEVLAARGGALLLFSSYADLDRLWEYMTPSLVDAGLTVLRQEREIDKADLGRRFKEDGNAVLFGTSSFATGFDAPGDALRFLGIWKVAYPGLDPVTRAISAASFDRYRDMALVETVQGIGRLIRTTSDRGRVFVADSRAVRMLINPSDPMVRHIAQMAQTTGGPS